MKPENIELCNKIVAGIKKAAQKLVEERAVKNETLVYCVDGKIVHVPARELLKNKSSK